MIDVTYTFNVNMADLTFLYKKKKSYIKNKKKILKYHNNNIKGCDVKRMAV